MWSGARRAGIVSPYVQGSSKSSHTGCKTIKPHALARLGRYAIEGEISGSRGRNPKPCLTNDPYSYKEFLIEAIISY